MKEPPKPLKNLLRSEIAKEPANNQADPKLDRAPKNPSLFLGILLGFLLRFITELVKYLNTG